MTLSELIKEILSEWGCRVDDGMPDPKNPQHLRELRDVLEVMGLSSIKNELIGNLLEGDNFKNPALNKVISYKSVNGEDAEGKVGNLLRRPSEEDAHKQAVSALGGEDSDTYKKAMKDLGGEGQPEKKAEKEKEGDGKSGEEKEQPKTGTALNPNTSAGKSYIDSLPDTDLAKKTAADTKIYSEREIQKEVEKLNSMDEYLTDADDDTKERAALLKESWNKYLNAQSKEEKIEAINEMAENNLIEAHMGGKKIYLSPNTALPYKHLTGGGSEGTAVTREMNELIKEAGIEVPARGNAKDRALADMSGKHNEAGVVSYLFPSDENKKAYESTQTSFKNLGGDEARFDEINKNAAESIKAILPEGAEITGAQQVGGIGKTALAQLGIDPKVDPTDLIVQYKDKDGNDQIMKISAKTYSDPKNITMKNAGTGNAGETYLGEIGKEIDEQIGQWRDEFEWDDSMSDEQKADKKRGLKQRYLQTFGDKMAELAKTEKGQEQLGKMWKDVHGCGQNVHTQIINKKTGKVDIKSPDYYCEPTPPFEIKYDGVKLVINMGGQDDKFLQMDMKTEDKGSPKLLFRHRTK
jgi:hypothetical protein